MLNILIIDNDNNDIDFWHQKLMSLELQQLEADSYSLNISNIETIDSENQNKKINVDCIWYNGNINSHLHHIKILQSHYPHSPIFEIEKSEQNFLINLFMSTDNINLNLHRLFNSTKEIIYEDTQNKSEAGFLGIFSCISDTVLIYNENKILFTNARAQDLILDTNNKIIDTIKNNSKTKQSPIIINDNTNNEYIFEINYVSTEWNNQAATMAILNDITAQEKEKQRLSHQLQDHVDAFTKANTALNENQSRLQLLMKSAGEGFWDWHIKEGEVFLSHRWKEMLGYDDDEIFDTFNAWANLIHPDDLGNFLLQWSQFMENKMERFNVEYRILCKDGRYTWVEARGVKEIDKNGTVVRLAGSHSDINKRKQIEHELNLHRDSLEEIIALRTKELEKANHMLEGLAKLDGLTELANRRCLDEALEQEVSRAHRENTNLSVLMLDIDYFKYYNDTFGHQEGDHCLKIVAKTISNSLMRPSDIVGRYGGEEFSVILPSTNIDGGLLIAQQIFAGIARIKTLKPNPHTGLPLTLSIGVACSTTEKKLTAEELIHAADEALYKAKDQGRNRIICQQ